MEVQSFCCRVRPLSSVLCRLSFLRPLSAVRCRLPFSRLLSVLALACVVCTAFSAETAGAREEARPKGLFADGAFRVGCNYWASHAGMMMWRNWDAAQVERDFAVLAANGIRVLRVFPLWPDFQPLTRQYGYGNGARCVAFRDGPLPNPAGVDEEMMRRFRFLCDAASRQGLKLVVGLVTGWMSGRTFVPDALQGVNLADPEATVWQVRFVRHFVRGMADHPAIAAWDLGNECNCLVVAKTPAQAWTWMNAIASAIRLEDASRPVVSGMHSLQADPTRPWNLRDQGELMDVLTTHPYPLWTPGMRREPFNSFRNGNHAVAESLMYAGVAGRPCFPEEAGDMGRTVCSEARAGLHVRTALYSTWAYGLGSYMWWCAFDQGHLDFAPYTWTAVECDLGLMDRNFRVKPVLAEMKAFVEATDALPFKALPPRQVDAVCLLSERESPTLPAAFGAFALARQAGFDVRFAGAEGEIPDAPFYILPSGEGFDPYTGTACRKVYARVRAGATLLVSKGNRTTLPDLAAVSGNDVDWTSDDGETTTVILEGHADRPLRVATASTVRILPTRSRVLDTSAAGNAFLTVCDYGKGKVVYVNAAIERDSYLRGGAYFGKDLNPLYLVYREAARIAGVRRRVEKDAAFPNVGLTEHPDGKGGAVVVAVNYDPEPVTCPIRVDGTVGTVWRGQVTDGAITLPANDAAIFNVKQN